MIYLQLTGGLGNQLFQYAFARALQCRTGEMIAINTYGFLFDPQREYSLSVYRLNPNVTVLGEKRGKVQWRCTSWINRFLYRLKKSQGAKNFYRLSRKGLYFTFDIYCFHTYAISSRRNKYVCGTFQTDRYFRDIRETILNELQVRVPVRTELNEWMDQVKGCESVCVHVRRGDYVTNEKDDKILNICSEEYYRKAMNWMSSQLINPVFYIFSNTHDDLKWIKENYHLEQNNIIYVDMENQDYEELLLMSSCKHFIIANSTYSWWAQYIGEFPDKKVAAPSRWFAGDQSADDIYMETWKIIEV